MMRDWRPQGAAEAGARDVARWQTPRQNSGTRRDIAAGCHVMGAPEPVRFLVVDHEEISEIVQSVVVSSLAVRCSEKMKTSSMCNLSGSSPYRASTASGHSRGPRRADDVATLLGSRWPRVDRAKG